MFETPETKLRPSIGSETDLRSDIVLIPSTQGKFFMIDAEDEPWVSQIKWTAAWINSGWYAVNWNNGGKPMYLHRFLMGNPEGMLVDHVNGDTLCCCKWNLRIATKQQNSCNRKKGTNSVFKGVRLRAGKWEARIGSEGKKFCVGRFEDPESAARAYDAAALKLHGEFARLNFPEAA